jgi:hypothetical protein
MSFLGRFLKKQPSLNTPNIPFGRYSDSYKSDIQYEHWEAAINAFDEENYIASLTFFLDFLKNDQENNVEKWSEEGILKFKIIQGSKKIIGRVHGTHIEVEAKVAKTKGLRLEFMHFLMERNYSLRYSRFALDEDNDISVRFDTELMDASPYKLYNALKEVATNADKLDDLLIDEYSDILFPVDNQHIEATTSQEKDVKYQFTQQWVKEVLLRAEKLDIKELDAGVAYLLLDLTYKLDYLIQPQGFMMESLERVHRQYFASDNKTIEEKCDLLLEEFKKIYNRPKEEFAKEIYHTIATFGITSPVDHDRVANFIDGELPNMDWYLNHNYADIALAIPGYIAGYCMFEFAVPQVDRCLFHLYFEIVKNDFFNSLGFDNDYYNASTAKFNKTAIKQQIQNIFKSNQRKHPLLKPNINMLDFTNLQLFSYSYMKMISALHLSED